MQLSMRFFYTKIAETVPGANLLLAGTMPAFSSSGIVTPGTTVSSDIIYIDLLPYDPRQLPAHASLVTTETRSDLFERCNMIVLPDGADLAAVADLISETFTHYFGWADKIYAAIAENRDLQTIIDLTAPIIDNPIYIADSSFKMLASWGGEFGEMNPTWRYQQKYRYLPYQVMQNLIDAGEVKRLYDTPEAWLVTNSSGFESLPFISKAIRRNGVHYGNFFIIALNRHLCACDIEIADYLGDVLSTALVGNLNYLQTSRFYHEHFLGDIVEGTLTNRQLISDQLKALGWELEGDYVLALFDTSQDNDAIRHHMMAFLTTGLDGKCLSYHGDVLAIMNRCGQRMSRIEARIGQVARDFNRTAAMSERFVDFAELGSHYQQARFALAEKSGPENAGRLFFYRDAFLDHLVTKLKDDLPIFAPVFLLRRHDESQGTEYCHTLYVWLVHERNTVHAAEALFIHRNTLKNRLERIQEIIAVDTDDIRVRLRLLLSLYEVESQIECSSSKPETRRYARQR